MFEAFINFMMLEHLGGLTFDPLDAPVGYFRQLDPDRQPFQTADGYISMVFYNDEAWPIAFEILGQSAFLDDERFATRKARVQNMALMYRGIARLTPGLTAGRARYRCDRAQGRDAAQAPH